MCGTYPEFSSISNIIIYKLLGYKRIKDGKVRKGLEQEDICRIVVLSGNGVSVVDHHW